MTIWYIFLIFGILLLMIGLAGFFMKTADEIQDQMYREQREKDEFEEHMRRQRR